MKSPEYVGQRARVHSDGNLYLARDLLVNGRYFPEHAVLDNDRLVWIGHPEGGQMEPLIEGYDAPGDFYELP